MFLLGGPFCRVSVAVFLHKKTHVYKKDRSTFPSILHFTNASEETLAKLYRILLLPIKQKQYYNLKMNIQNKYSIQLLSNQPTKRMFLL